MKISIKKIFSNFIMFILGAISGGLILLLFVFIFVNSSSYVTVPELKNETKNTAIKALREIGLIPIVQGVGEKVLYTEPPAGKKVKKGRHVFVQLGNIEPLKVPDLIGIPLQVAEQFLISYELNYQITKIYAPEVEIETVIDMEPKPGSVINKGDKITLTVAYSEVNE